MRQSLLHLLVLLLLVITIAYTGNTISWNSQISFVNLRSDNDWLISILIITILGWMFFLIGRKTEEGKVPALREKICRDLHDHVGSNLSAINIMASVLRDRLIKSPHDNQTEILNEIVNLCTKSVENLDNVVLSIHKYQSLEEIIGKMRYEGASFLETQNINFQLIVEGDASNFKLGLDRANDFFLIYKEAITNAAKYAKCKNVTARLAIQKRNVWLQIIDDGVGFNHDVVWNGHGLNNMRKRSENLKGKFKLDSQPEFGTRIAVRFSA
jgi:signal transduction histidine kinase